MFTNDNSVHAVLLKQSGEEFAHMTLSSFYYHRRSSAFSVYPLTPELRFVDNNTMVVLC